MAASPPISFVSPHLEDWAATQGVVGAPGEAKCEVLQDERHHRAQKIPQKAVDHELEVAEKGL